MGETWLKFLEGKIDAKAVLEKYKDRGSTNHSGRSGTNVLLVRAPENHNQEHGFDANQDIPGNMLWEELYAASPKGQKV